MEDVCARLDKQDWRGSERANSRRHPFVCCPKRHEPTQPILHLVHAKIALIAMHSSAAAPALKTTVPLIPYETIPGAVNSTTDIT